MGTLPEDWFFRSRLKLRHLQLFVALGEQGNLHRSAEMLGISQPAASRLLIELEERLGTTLFERHGRGLTPNLYGELMIRRARTIIDELERAGEEFNAIHAGHAGLVRVGTVMEPAVALLTRAIEQMHSERPKLRINVNVDVSRALISGLMDGHYNFVISRIPAGFSGEHFVFEEIGEEEICFICSRSHPLAEQPVPALSAMVDYPWALQPPGTLMRQRVDDLLRHRGLEPPHWIVDTSDLTTSLALVNASSFLTVATRGVAELLCDPQRFRIISSSTRLSVQPYGLVSLRRQQLPPGVAAMMRLLRQLIRQPSPI